MQRACDRFRRGADTRTGDDEFFAAEQMNAVISHCGNRGQGVPRVEVAGVARVSPCVAHLQNHVRRPCEKRSIGLVRLAQAVEEIANEIETSGGEISSAEIGSKALERLREIDEVAYLRYASVHRRFEDVTRIAAERPGQDAAYVIDSSLARTQLGWRPEIPLATSSW